MSFNLFQLGYWREFETIYFIEIIFFSVFCRVWQFLIGSAVFFLSRELIDLDTKVNKYTELLLEEKSEELSDEENENNDDEELIMKPRQNLSRAPFYILLWSSLMFLVFLSFAPWTIPEAALRMVRTTFFNNSSKS